MGGRFSAEENRGHTRGSVEEIILRGGCVTTLRSKLVTRIQATYFNPNVLYTHTSPV